MSKRQMIRLVALAVFVVCASGCVSYSRTHVCPVAPEEHAASTDDHLGTGCYVDAVPLRTLIDEVNRCSASRQFEIADPAGGDIRLGGALCLCSSDSVVTALRSLGIEMVEKTVVSIDQTGDQVPIRQASQQEFPE